MSLVRQLGTYGIADVLGAAVTLLTSPITTRLLTPEQFGAQPLLDAVWGVIALAQYGGADWALPFFRARPGSDPAQVTASSSRLAVVSLLMVTSLFAGIALTTPWLAAMAGVSTGELACYLGSILPLSWAQWHLYILRYEQQALAYTRTALLRRVAAPVLGIPLLLLVPASDRLAWWLAIAGISGGAALCWSFRELSRLGIHPYEARRGSGQLAREMVSYGMVLVPAGAVYSLITVTDRLLVGYLAGPAQVAILSLSVGIGSILLMMKRWFMLAFDPVMADWIAHDEPGEYTAKIDRAVVMLALIFIPPALLIDIWVDPLVTLLYPLSYAPMKQLIPLTVLGAAISVFSLLGVATTLVRQSRFAHLPIYTASLAVNVAVCLLLIPSFGAAGAVAGTVAAEAVILASWIVLGRWIFRNLPVRWSRAGGPLLLLAAATGAIEAGQLPLGGLAGRVAWSLAVLAGTAAAALAHEPWAAWRGHWLEALGRRSQERRQSASSIASSP